VQPVLDLVACAYQAPEATEAFLRQSREHVGLTFTLCVIENSSPDDSVRQVLKGPALDAVRALPNCADATVIFNETNVGYARAINHGVSLGHRAVRSSLEHRRSVSPGRRRTEHVLAYLDRHQDVGSCRATHSRRVRAPHSRRDCRKWLND
jgi:GT2 family glycosyltransferase